MLPLEHPDRIQISFDDPRLVANTGLLLPVTLAQHLGLRELVDNHVDLGAAPGRANPGDKLMTLVASALAGGDCIDDADVLRTGGTACPASTIFAGWRQSVLPVHLLGLAPLLGSVGPVAGNVKLQDDGVVHDPVNRRGGDHRVGKDAFPLREDQVRRDAQRPAFVAFGNQGEEDFRLFGALGQVAQVVEEQEVEVVQFAEPAGQIQVALGGQQFLHQAVKGGAT